MSQMTPAEAAHPVRPDPNSSDGDRGRAESQTRVVGIAETSRAVFGAEDVGEEIFEIEEES